MNLYRFVALMLAIAVACVAIAGAEESLIERLKKNHQQRLARMRDGRATATGAGAYASSLSSAGYVNGAPVHQEQQSVYETQVEPPAVPASAPRQRVPRPRFASATSAAQASGNGARAASFANAHTAPIYQAQPEVRPAPTPAPAPAPAPQPRQAPRPFGGAQAASGAQASGSAQAASFARAQTGPSGPAPAPAHQAPVKPVPAETETNLKHSQAESFSESYVEPETDNVRTEVSGSYENDGDGFESESYQRMTEYDQEEEDGSEDDDHHYKAKSSAKDLDENYDDKFHNAYEDTIYGDGFVRLSKGTTLQNTNYNKKQRESGTEVMTRDRHRANFNRRKNKMLEMVDHQRHIAGAGSDGSESLSTSLEHEDEDSSEFDSDKLGQFKPPPMPIRDAARATSRAAANGSGRSRAGGPGAASASSAVTDGGLSTSAAVGQRAKTSSTSKLHQ